MITQQLFRLYLDIHRSTSRYEREERWYRIRKADYRYSGGMSEEEEECTNALK